MSSARRPLIALRNRILWLFRRRQLERDLEEELRFHIAMKQAEGRSPQEAQRELGNRTLIKENSREVFGFPSLEMLWQDFRYGARMLRRNPAVAVVAILSLALGIGANTSIFSFLNAILLSKLPVAEPDQLVLVRQHSREYDMLNTAFSYPFYRELSHRSNVFSSLLGRFVIPVNVTANGYTERVQGEIVSGSYFRTLGVHAFLGRILTEDDDRTEGANPVCVISYDYWQDRFGGDPNILKRPVLLNARPFQIAGVTEPGFHGAAIHEHYALQVPTSMISSFFAMKRDSDGWSWLQILGRLKPGITLAQAEAEVDTVGHSIRAAKLNAEERRQDEQDRFRLLSGRQGFDYQRNLLQKPTLVLMAVVVLVLLIACANVANLLLSRGVAREKEMAVRLSLGATRRRLIRQLLIESGILAGLGGFAGLLLSLPFIRLLLYFLNTPSTALQVQLDGRVLFFTAALTCATALLFGSIPAWQAARPDLQEALQKSSAAGGNYGRAFVRGVLVITQIALSIVLLFGSGLFVRTLHNLETLDLGFRSDHMLLMSLNPAMSGYRATTSQSMLSELLQRVRQIPGVEAASMAAISPLSGGMMAAGVQVQGFKPPVLPEPNFNFNFIAGDYFHTLGTPLLLGRVFNDRDIKAAPNVAIVNEQFVSYIWPGRKTNPIGQEFKCYWGPGAVKIVGVVKNSKYQEIREKPQIIVYFPLAQHPVDQLTVLVRTSGEPKQMLRAMTQVVHGVDSKLPVYDITTLDMQMNRSISRERILTFLSTLFGALATLLAAIGLYGLVAYSVVSRTREIGIRFAIGAQAAEMTTLFLRETLLLIGIGVTLGSAIALASSRVLSSLLFGVTARDTRTLAAAVIVLVLSGCLAILAPLRRAIKVNPVVALRYE